MDRFGRNSRRYNLMHRIANAAAVSFIIIAATIAALIVWECVKWVLLP